MGCNGGVITVRESRSDPAIFLLMAICCAAPILLVIGGPLLIGFISKEGIPVLVGLGLVLGGYLLWRRKRQKGCCPGETDGKD